ncbi:MAG: acetylglutamate kinase [Eubacteriales bacterium]|nr:acetylglutamate kinase [Eubacteriales bacterium]MDD3200294.1 acetylglutamate kinase [Eubacteriales bacterium]MDD4122291.1 acetylglutamate kinase [Eubacteriales bacterium]MDD4630251.1 acetylglutamate kinase [Eubacteriales bacterium]
MKDTITRATVLLEALPYIQKFCNKVIVIKYGGNAMISDTLKKAVMKDIALLTIVGIKVVLVHGGGPEISSMLKTMGKESIFIDGLRYTDEETAEVAAMVLAGKVNKNLVSMIQQHNGKAIGLCGLDGGMLQVDKLQNEVDLGFVGDIKKVEVSPIIMALKNGFTPVIATIGADKNGQTYNINADTAAAAIAGALKAEKLILMTDVRGLLMNKDDEDSLISKINIEDVPRLIEEGIIDGGMIPKIKSCIDGIKNGIKEAVIIDGRIEHSILIELFSDEGIGTLLFEEKEHPQ